MGSSSWGRANHSAVQDPFQLTAGRAGTCAPVDLSGATRLAICQRRDGQLFGVELAYDYGSGNTFVGTVGRVAPAAAPPATVVTVTLPYRVAG